MPEADAVWKMKRGLSASCFFQAGSIVIRTVAFNRGSVAFFESSRVTPIYCHAQHCPVVQHAHVLVARRSLKPQVLVRFQVGQPTFAQSRVGSTRAACNAGSSSRIDGRPSATGRCEHQLRDPWAIFSFIPYAPVAQQNQSGWLRTRRSQVQFLPGAPAEGSFAGSSFLFPHVAQPEEALRSERRGCGCKSCRGDPFSLP
jgi:hypothetical protein